MNQLRWTALPPLPLHGVSTHLVESLEHYVARIAACCSVSLPALYRELYPKEQCGNRYPKIHINGLGHNFSVGVSAIEELTGIPHLHCETFLNLEAILDGRSTEFQGRYRRWCPRCLGEWRSKAYEPLIWRLGDMPICSIHRCALAETCPSCGKRQYLPATYERRRFCSACGASLAGGGVPPDVDWLYLEHAERCAKEFIEICVDPEQSPLPYSAYVTCYNALLSVVPSPIDNDIRRILRHVPPSKTSCRRLIDVCAVRSMGPRTLLLAPSEAISAPMLIEPYHVTWGVRGTEGSATRLLRLLVDAMVYFMKPRISGHFAPATPRLLKLIGVGRNLLLDSAPRTHDAYETFRHGQGSDYQLRRAEAAVSVALNLLIRIRSRWNFERQFSRMAGKIALESGVSTILARKCLRAAIYLQGLKTRADGTSVGTPWAEFPDERASPRTRTTFRRSFR